MKHKCVKGPTLQTKFVSFGRLLEAGWGIDGQEKTLCFGSQVKIASEMQHKSLIAAQAKIRKVEALPCFVRALDAVEVKLGNELKVTGGGRSMEASGLGFTCPRIIRHLLG